MLMKAVVTTGYGSPDVLKLQEVITPTPSNEEVRVQIYAASVGPSDCAFRKGDPFVVKLIYGLKKPKYAIMGTELSGIIDAVGKDVKHFKPGDAVFGISASIFGAHAEYVCLPERTVLAVKSASMTYEDAAAISDGAPTALTFLRDKANVQPGQKVLVNGASGAVGIYAVQLAKYYGAEVTGVCSTANIDMVKSFGADHVIDYTKEDFTISQRSYDVIFDAVGKRTFGQCKRSLKQQGLYLATTPTLSNVGNMLWTSIFSRKKAIFATAGLMQSKENLIFLKELFEQGKLKSAIDRRYPLEQAAEAHRYVETERKKGNVVLTIRKELH